ncbi:MAG TPA: transcriptional regulator [Edaphocola sp.]|nr:transcriptional regulator [Edaphocola sp.]
MNLVQSLHKDFESRVRLGLMSVLMVNDWIDFKEMKSLLNVTDGNLASHASALEKAGYIEVKKEFVGKKTRTAYRITHPGRTAFSSHLRALEHLIRNS